MYTSVHGANNSLQDVHALISRMRAAGQNDLADLFQEHVTTAFGKLTEEVEDLNRKYREGDDSGTSSGGGYSDVRTGSNIPRKVIPVCNFIYQTQSFGKDIDESFNASEPISADPWNRGKPIEILKPVADSVTLTKAIGQLLVEGNGTHLPIEYWLDMSLEMGSGQIGSNHLLSFACGFERYNAERLKFFLDVYEYERPLSHSNSAILTDYISNPFPLPIASRKFRSDQPILTEALLTEYQNSGLRVYLDITVYGSI